MSIGHNGIFDHMYFTAPDNLLNIQNIMMQYQYFTKVVLNFKEVL